MDAAPLGSSRAPRHRHEARDRDPEDDGRQDRGDRELPRDPQASDQVGERFGQPRREIAGGAIGRLRALRLVAQRSRQAPRRRADDVRPAGAHDRVDQAQAHLGRHARDLTPDIDEAGGRQREFQRDGRAHEQQQRAQGRRQADCVQHVGDHAGGGRRLDLLARSDADDRPQAGDRQVLRRHAQQHGDQDQDLTPPAGVEEQPEDLLDRLHCAAVRPSWTWKACSDSAMAASGPPLVRACSRLGPDRIDMGDAAGDEGQSQEVRRRQPVGAAPHVDDSAGRGHAEADLVIAAIGIAALLQAAEQVEIGEVIVQHPLLGIADDPAGVHRHPLLRRLLQPTEQPGGAVIVAMGGVVLDIPIGRQLRDRPHPVGRQPRHQEAPLQAGHGARADLAQHLARVDGDARRRPQFRAYEVAIAPRRIPCAGRDRQGGPDQPRTDRCGFAGQDALNSPRGAGVRPRRWARGRPHAR